MSGSSQVLASMQSAPAATLDEVLITPVLARRPIRPRDRAVEAAAFRTIGQAFENTVPAVMQALVDMSLRLCGAGTAGLSLLEPQPDGTEMFRWAALAGALSPRSGVSTPRDFSPCGACLDRGAPILLDRPARRFTYLQSLPPAIAETLIVPVPVVGGPIGTLWAASHDHTRRFDAEDLRQLTSLAAFGAAGIAAARLHHADLLARESADRTSADLRRSNDDLEDFSHIIAHDLKEPLRGIRHHAACIGEDFGGQLGEAGRNRLGRIDRLAGRVMEMIGGLLEYSRAGQGDLAVAPVDLGAVVAVAVELLGARIEEIQAEISVHGSFPTVRCDSARIGEVFANLISNGLKYNRSEPKRIEIGALSGGAGPSIFYVRDNGIGIRPEDAKRLFRVFTRLRDAEAFGEGSGSGLAIARKIVTRHHGRIWFHSAPDEGTTFFFTLGQAGHSHGSSS